MYPLPLAAFAALLIAAPALPAPIPPQQELAYRLPSPPTATYHVVDTTRINMGTPLGPMEGSGNSSFTLAVSFTADGDGIRAVGELTEFTAQGNEPMRGPASISRSLAGVGNFDLLLGPQGMGEVVTRVIQGADSDLPMWADPTEGMFPRLPAGRVQPGDTWVDTVTGSVAGDRSERVAVYTYTLDGETIVDGRPHLRVTFSADVRLFLEASGGAGDEQLTGTETGFFLWDVGRGLVAQAEIARSFEGTIEIEDDPPMSMTTTAVTRVRLGM